MKNIGRWISTLAVAALMAAPALAEDFLGMEEGAPGIKQAGPLAFGPFGVLFVGDAKSATVFAVATGDKQENKNKSAINVDKLNEKAAAALGVAASEISINDLAVNPLSGNVYLSAATKVGNGKPALFKVDGKGKVSALSLEKIKFSKTVLANAPEDKLVKGRRRSRNLRDESITDLAYVDGQLLVAGLNKGDSPSAVRTLAFPFTKASQDAKLQIYHAAHGRDENSAVIRTFVPFTINGKPNLLAGFTCTPLVKFPLGDIAAGKQIKGTTVAELGNRNRPYDMIVYKKEGKSFLLMANSARGVMKISTDDIERDEGLTQRVSGGGVAGQEYETIKAWKNVVQLDALNDTHAVVVIDDQSTVSLKTVPLP